MYQSFNPYDLTSAFDAAISSARDTGEARFVVQTCYGYQVRTELGLALYKAWHINADGSVDDAKPEVKILN